MPTSALVALIRSAPATVLDDIERLMLLARFGRRLDPGAATLLRPDARRHFPFPAANTTPWQLEGVALALRAAGCQDLAWMPPRRSVANIGTGEDLNGYQPLLRDQGIARQPAGDTAARAASMVLLPTLKTDATTALGGALWCLPGDRASPRGTAGCRAPERLVGALAACRRRRAEIFAVMDGTTVGMGPGPYMLRPEIRGVLLASADPVALDAVAARLIGLDPLRDVAYLRLAHERGLGVADTRAIELAGDSDLARERWAPAGRSPRQLRAERRLAALLGGALERFRWPIAERRVFESWLRGTPWGRLFARYQRQGYGDLSPSPQPAEYQRT